MTGTQKDQLDAFCAEMDRQKIKFEKRQAEEFASKLAAEAAFLSNPSPFKREEIDLLSSIIGEEHLSLLIESIKQISKRYTYLKSNQFIRQDLHSHMVKIEAIRAAARKLEQLLSQETLVDQIYWSWESWEAAFQYAREDYEDQEAVQEADEAEYNLIEERRAQLPALLKIVQRGAAELSEDPIFLRKLHLTSQGEYGRSSLEQKCIWEPVFDLFRKIGRSVGYSNNGPLVRFLSIIHNALGAPAIPVGGLRYAIKRYDQA